MEAIKTFVPKKFDLREVTKTEKKNFSMIVCGKTCTGKSHMLRELLSTVKDDYEKAYVFCKTIDLQPVLYDYIPEENRFNTFDQVKLEKIYTDQKRYVMGALDKDPHVDKDKLNHILIILDDCISDPSFRKSSVLNELFIAGRHSCISLVICTQIISSREGVPTICLKNCDFFLCFYLQAEACRELALGKYLSMNGIKEANEIFKMVTGEKYRAMVVNNRITSQNYEDVVYYYKAEPKPKKFKIGNSLSSKRLTQKKIIWSERPNKKNYYI